MKLKSLTIEKLSRLRSEVDAALSLKVVEQRRTIEAELQKLSRVGTRRTMRLRGGGHGPVAPKYRNPANSSETWAGRGLKPRWLVAALKSGKKLEHFSIAAAGKAVQRKARKKPRKAARKVRPTKPATKKVARRSRPPAPGPSAAPVQSATAPAQV